MRFVKNWDQVVANIRTLEDARSSPDPALHKAYVSLIKGGTCFVAYQSDAGVAFAPSKFIGYVNNEIAFHIKVRGERDGRDTNKALKGILDRAPERNSSAESMYLDFCRGMNFEPNKKGTFGAFRKFWVTDAAAVAAIQSDQTLTRTEKEQLVKARLGQGQFRKDLISLWGGCCLTGCVELKLLRASHIKPWSSSDNRERLDKFNGLLLTPNADALFNDGYITFAADGKLIVSKRLPEKAGKVLLAGCKERITVHNGNKPYLEYHRKNRFRDSAVQQGAAAHTEFRR